MSDAKSIIREEELPVVTTWNQNKSALVFPVYWWQRRADNSWFVLISCGNYWLTHPLLLILFGQQGQVEVHQSKFATITADVSVKLIGFLKNLFLVVTKYLQDFVSIN